MNIKEIILTERVLHPYTPAGKEAIRMMEPVVQTTADAARAGANELTYGHYDKGAAAANATIKGTDYDTELKKQYAKSAEAEKRSPIASEVGKLASYAVPLAPATLGAKLAVKGATKILPKVLDTTAKKAINIGGKGTAVVGGGVAGDLAAKEVATQFDPNNPKLKENLFAKAAKAGLNFLQKDVRGTAASGAKANKLNTAAGQTPAPGSLKPPTMTGGQGPTSPVPSSTPAPTPKTSPTDAERIANLEKQVNPSIGRKVANWAAKTAGTTAAIGGTAYVGWPAVKKYAFSPADDSPHTNKYDKSDYTTKWKAAQAEKEKQEAEADAKSQEQNLNLHSRPQSTDTDNGGTFSRDTFKESSTELERVKYLTQYRS
jgi:hypothetical protein